MKKYFISENTYETTCKCLKAWMDIKNNAFNSVKDRAFAHAVSDYLGAMLSESEIEPCEKAEMPVYPERSRT